MKKVRMAILGAGPRGQCLGEVYPLNPQLEIVGRMRLCPGVGGGAMPHVAGEVSNYGAGVYRL